MTGIERLREYAKGCRIIGQITYSNAIGDIADQIERETQPKRDPAADVSMSAYDLLPADERDAIAWVREHGGLDYVREEWRSRVPYDRYERRRQSLLRHISECETALGRRNQRIEELGHRVSDLTAENAELRKRAMPDGYEWPRFEDGEFLKYGDVYIGNDDKEHEAWHIEFDSDGDALVLRSECCGSLEMVRDVFCKGERVRRPAPKVLDADGAEIREGDTVYEVKTGEKFVVETIYDGTTEPDFPEHTVRCSKPGDLTAHMFAPDMITHRAPVIAADGNPLREGETVWSVDSGTRYTVEKNTDELIPIKCRSEMGTTVSLHPSQLTHERPVADTWERLEEDADRGPQGGMDFEEFARDLVRRAKALAERDAK